jgi:DNA-binding phage protein
MDFKQQIEAKIAKAGGVMPLARNTGVPRETIYNLKRGKNPSLKTMAALGLKFSKGGA